MSSIRFAANYTQFNDCYIVSSPFGVSFVGDCTDILNQLANELGNALHDLLWGIALGSTGAALISRGLFPDNQQLPSIDFARNFEDADWIPQEYNSDDVNYGSDHWKERKARCWDDVLPNGSEEDIANGRQNRQIENVARRIIDRPDKTMFDSSSGNHHWVGQENDIWIHIVVHTIYRGSSVIRDIVQALFCQDPDCDDPHPCV